MPKPRKLSLAALMIRAEREARFELMTREMLLDGVELESESVDENDLFDYETSTEDRFIAAMKDCGTLL